MKNDLITVIMPCYNTERYINQAIESILNQTYKNFELIVIDDGSNDKTYDLAREYERKDNRVKVLKNKNSKGIAGAMNTGLDLAKGKYITRMDSDDLSKPERLMKQYKFLCENKEYNACSVNIYAIDKKGKRKSETLFKNIKNLPKEWIMIYDNPVPNAPIMYSSNIIKKNNLKFDEKLKTAEDYSFLSNYIINGGKITMLEESLYEYRYHNTNISKSNYFITVENSIKVVDNYIKTMTDISVSKSYYYFTVFKQKDDTKQKKDIKQKDAIKINYYNMFKDIDNIYYRLKDKYNWNDKESKAIEEDISRLFLALYDKMSSKNETILQRLKRNYNELGFLGVIRKILKKILKR